LLEVLRTPDLRDSLTLSQNGQALLAVSSGKEYPLVDGIVSLVHPPSLEGSNLEMSRLYRWLAPFYEWNERFMGKHLLKLDMDRGRSDIITKVGVQPGTSLLEVSPGPGVFQPWLRSALKPAGHLVALDLSLPMLRQCRRKHGNEGAVLVHGNAEYLPFADACFDAAFHFGGVNLFTQPERALAELVRVVRPGGRVAYGDEGFDPSYPDGWRKRLLCRINPGFAKVRPNVPAGLTEVSDVSVYGGMAYLVVATKR
jgi:ubiquinone/menaquinone biosynthesis C-methylase UbiE